MPLATKFKRKISVLPLTLSKKILVAYKGPKLQYLGKVPRKDKFYLSFSVKNTKKKTN